MSIYTVYETTTGKIISTLYMSVDNNQNVRPGIALIEGSYKGANYWISNGVAVERMVMDVTINITGLQCTVSNIPEGTEVSIDGTHLYTADNTGEVTHIGTRSYMFALHNLPYKDKEIRVGE